MQAGDGKSDLATSDVQGAPAWELSGEAMFRGSIVEGKSEWARLWRGGALAWMGRRARTSTRSAERGFACNCQALSLYSLLIPSRSSALMSTKVLGSAVVMRSRQTLSRMKCGQLQRAIIVVSRF